MSGLFNEVHREIDCTTCGNCCKEFLTVFEKEDIENISQKLGINPESFAEKFPGAAVIKFNGREYLEKALASVLHNWGYVFSAKPCHFLKNNLCLCYEVRPQVCRTFPRLGAGVIERMNEVLDNYQICPIVFNVYERLKSEFQF